MFEDTIYTLACQLLLKGTSISCNPCLM